MKVKKKLPLVLSLIFLLTVTFNLVPSALADPAPTTQVKLHATITPASEVASITISLTVDGASYSASSGSNPSPQGNHWDLSADARLYDTTQAVVNSITVSWKDGTSTTLSGGHESAIGNGKGVLNIQAGSITKPVLYTVTYQVSGPTPATYSTAPQSASYTAGTPVTVAGPLTTTETSNGALLGTWTFSGWSTTQATISSGTFNMPAKNVILTGSWSFTEVGKYLVTYQVTGQTPETHSALPSGASYYAAAPVTVAGPLTTEETTNGELQGTWTFDGWSTSDATVSDGSFTMPEHTVTLLGSWSFSESEKYTVTYQVGSPAPASYSTLPASAEYYAGATVALAGPLTTTETTNGELAGTWFFDGWSTTDVTVSGEGFTMPATNVTLTGNWIFVEAGKYLVTYQVSGPVPATYSALPSGASYYAGTPVTVAGPLTTDETTNGTLTGTWVFDGWSTTDAALSGGGFTMPEQTVTLLGTWTFNESDKYPVTYQVSGPAPATYSDLPSSASYYAGTPVTVAGPLTTTENAYGSTTGTWTFLGWSTSDVSPSGGGFTMPATAVVFTGTWRFVESGVGEDEDEPEDGDLDDGEVAGDVDKPEDGEVAGDVDKPEDGEVAGDSDKLPDAGGVATSGLLLLAGVALIGTGITALIIGRKKEAEEKE